MRPSWGMRASAMMHLPGLVIASQMDKVVRAVNQLGIAVRGLVGVQIGLPCLDGRQLGGEPPLEGLEIDRVLVILLQAFEVLASALRTLGPCRRGKLNRAEKRGGCQRGSEAERRHGMRTR